ncbi:acyl transferase/acyl hydrolase/lysophospholipase [Phyllosticta capitalensis]|uniref:Acyl transferase/acyl hydrolase/lysophospholipase n=1 Tax=Phyllosticta capitalensis TaxID=121624 RepID=A0ABR1YE52_9PEZI
MHPPRLEMEGSKPNPRAPLRLLSLDGGGVRGLSSLMVLDDLMENIALEEKRLGMRPASDNEPLKPCDYFDLIGGTSTGGIIAILLGRLRLDIKSCIAIYSELAEQIFKNDRSFNLAGMKVPIGKTRFSGAVLENAIKKSLVKLGYDEDEPMWDDSLFEEHGEQKDGRNDSIWADVPEPTLTESPRESLSTESRATTPTKLDKSKTTDSFFDSPPTKSFKRHNRTNTPTWRVHRHTSVHRKPNQRGCRAFVVSALKNALGLPRILSTYDPNDRSTRIWEALRATSAAPTFFEEMTFGTPRMTYLDGGVGFNNPCAEVDYAAKSIWEGRPIGVIVSVGTGLQTIPSVKKVASWLPFGLGTDIALASALGSLAAGTARVHSELSRMYYETPTHYYRFDVDGGLANISLEQWMMEDEMAALTEQYMCESEQVRRAQQFGELIVKLSALPPKFEIPATTFRTGITGRGLIDGSFIQEELDFKTGFPLGVVPTLSEHQNLNQLATTSPSGQRGFTLDSNGRVRGVLPIALDLDGDGRREECAVLTCKRADNVCLRALRTGIPPGRYRVSFIVSLFTPQDGCAIPSEVVFSVGKPLDVTTFAHRVVDVKITPDVVPVLLGADAVRVRVGRTRYAETNGKGWIEVTADVEVDVGLEGALGLLVTKSFEKGVFVGGWSFGGVRLEPVGTQ